MAMPSATGVEIDVDVEAGGLTLVSVSGISERKLLGLTIEHEGFVTLDDRRKPLIRRRFQY